MEFSDLKLYRQNEELTLSFRPGSDSIKVIALGTYFLEVQPKAWKVFCAINLLTVAMLADNLYKEKSFIKKLNMNG